MPPPRRTRNGRHGRSDSHQGRAKKREPERPKPSDRERERRERREREEREREERERWVRARGTILRTPLYANQESTLNKGDTEKRERERDRALGGERDQR